MLISKYGNGSEELVSEFEGRYGIVLDEEYRRFLVKYNGGDTPNTRVGIRGFSSDLRYLYGINTEENIEAHMQIPAWEDRRCLPVGTDYYGNYYVIGTADEDKGVMYFCDHEKGFALKKLTDSFNRFLNKCKSEGINPRALIPPEEREASLIAKGRAHVITDGLRAIWKQEYDKYRNMNPEEVILD